MAALQKTIDCIREFNRFYTVRLGFLDQNYLGTGYSITEMRILFEINASGGVNAKTLSDRLRMDKSYISRLVRSMEQRGLLLRKVSKSDRRSFDLYLTQTGQDEMARLISATHANIQKIVAPFDAKEQEALCQAMTFIMEKLSK